MSRYDPLDFIVIVVLSPTTIILLYLIFILMPVQIIAESKCLDKGYPKTKTTVWLKSYCINLDGAVTNKVVPLGGE